MDFAPIRSVLHDDVRALLESNPLGVAIMRHHRNDDGQLTARRIFANDSLRWMFGAPTMDGFLERPVPDSWVEVSALQKVNESFSERSPLVGFEAERVNWDGHKFWVSMTGQSVALGGEDLTIVWHLDITDRVELAIGGPETVRVAAGDHQDFIRSETLAHAIEIAEGVADAAFPHVREVDINGTSVWIGLRPSGG